MKDKDIKRNKGRPSGFVLSDETKSKIANGLANKPNQMNIRQICLKQV
jgi:hypothetical protein